MDSVERLGDGGHRSGDKDDDDDDDDDDDNRILDAQYGSVCVCVFPAPVEEEQSVTGHRTKQINRRTGACDSSPCRYIYMCAWGCGPCR